MAKLVQLIAIVLLLALLWKAFRYAMGLRWAKVSREESRRVIEAQGQRVVAELPLAEGVEFVLEDHAAIYWRGAALRRQDIAGARLLLNGGVIAVYARPGWQLPEPPLAEEYEGRERWDVLVYLASGGAREIPCGTLREGVSREAAQQVFAAVKNGIEGAPG